MPEPAVWVLADAASTAAFGEDLGRALAAPACVLLRGGLGAGKTTLAQGVGRALGHPGLTSPTFALLMEHPGGVPVLHVDLWRIEAHELAGIGLEESLERWPGVSLVEWGDRFPDALPLDRLEVSLESAGEGRRATVSACGPRSSAALARLRAGGPALG